MAGEGNGLFQPVFLHSSFRTCSTWLWIRFREAEGTVAFNEYFNPVLADLTEDFAITHGPDSWPSFHPPTAPYFLEFLPLLTAPAGIRDFSADLAIKHFIPADGVAGCLSAEEGRYVAGLIKLACRQGKSPVLSCTRTLGRIGALRRMFGGYHIFLYRNLYQQWKSYLHLYEMGFDYFISTLIETMQHSAHDRFINHVRKYFLFRCADQAFPLVEHHREDLFVVFMALHLYLSLIGYEQADLRIDANATAADEGYRGGIERAVQAATGLVIDLSDACVVSQRPRTPLRQPERAWRMVEGMFQHALICAGSGPEAAAFGRALLATARATQQREG